MKRRRHSRPPPPPSAAPRRRRCWRPRRCCREGQGRARRGLDLERAGVVAGPVERRNQVGQVDTVLNHKTTPARHRQGCELRSPAAAASAAAPRQHRAHRASCASARGAKLWSREDDTLTAKMRGPPCYRRRLASVNASPQLTVNESRLYGGGSLTALRRQPAGHRRSGSAPAPHLDLAHLAPSAAMPDARRFPTSTPTA